jgi:hypothetical protein
VRFRRRERARLRLTVLRLGGLLGWGPRDVIGFAETLTGHSWQRCGRTDLEVIRDEFLALRWVIRRKAVRRSACPPTPCAHVSTDYRHAAQN